VPIILFLESHQTTFERFVKSNVLHPDFIRSLLSCTTNLFPTEDAKFHFLQHYSSSSAAPDFSLYRTIRSEDLTTDAVNIVLSDPDIPRHCKTFPVLVRVIREGEQLSGVQSALLEEISALRMRRRALDERRDEFRRIRDSTTTLSAAVEAEGRVRARALAFADQLELVSACVAILAVADDNAREFVGNVHRLAAMTERMGAMLEGFRAGGGWLFYPKSSDKGVDVKAKWSVALKELEHLTNNFILNPNAVFRYSTSLAMIAEGLRS
jgi:hypothetical protein